MLRVDTLMNLNFSRTDQHIYKCVLRSMLEICSTKKDNSEEGDELKAIREGHKLRNISLRF